MIDDVMTRTWWDAEPENHGLGRNIPRDFDALTVTNELAALKAVHAMGIPIMVFVVGYVLDVLRAERRDVAAALAWIVEQNIPIAGHGYYHTRREYEDGYDPWAAMTMRALQRVGQRPPYVWRYPRHEAVNEAYVRGVGFELAHYDHYLDPELNERRTLDVLRGHEGHACWVHSCYVTRVHLEEQARHAATTHPAHAA